jgi:hypothetical protein
MHILEIDTLWTVMIVVIMVVTPCSLVGGYQHFERTYRLHLQGRSVYAANIVRQYHVGTDFGNFTRLCDPDAIK